MINSADDQPKVLVSRPPSNVPEATPTVAEEANRPSARSRAGPEG
ncbi:hypothetical protein HNQ95_004872 [Aminobacter ciceronei]|uniref:Uncharacterized protein n=1 Tax=Aminobacter ciceronei TaxID=150723 RepID=A0ABR6CCT7_9HYPH|nr:hypothetical protein [Aminobacter ciceronei]MBA8909075.1 hypothetical protein [Aminobacter ciceronei]MBA9022847.1 hypothetical protein [Aminobacter ciceronei]